MGSTTRTGRRAPAARRTAALAALLVLVVVASSCKVTTADRIATQRSAAGRSALVRSTTLDASADARARAACAARSAAPSADPLEEYDQETAAAADDLVGAATLDPSIADGAARNIAATNAVLDQWAGNPIVTDARWDHLGIGEANCGDGKLYVAAAFTQRPTMPATGRYASIQYEAGQVTRTSNLRYATRPNHAGVPTDLFVDLWTPPSTGAPRPLIVLIHGGAFVGGSRDNMAGPALDYARRGFVVASISYRLRLANDPNLQLLGANDAIADGMEAVRYLRSKAATYEIDTTRIAAMGSSAGGVVALGLAVAEDTTPPGPLAAYSPRIDAGISTGAHLTPGLPVLTLTAGDAPVMMFNHEQDPSAGPAEYAFETCAAVRAGGNTCDFRLQPGTNHTSYIYGNSSFWAPDTGPFLWQHLRLGR